MSVLVPTPQNLLLFGSIQIAVLAVFYLYRRWRAVRQPDERSE